MLVGVMSDTHDNVENIRKAVMIFNRKKVDLVIHAGDITSPFSLKPFERLKADLVGIYGNNDGDLLLLNDRSRWRFHKQPHQFEFGGKKIIVIHEHHLVDALADSGHYDILVYGHTHKAVTRKKGDTLIVNPGETGSQLYGKATVAVIDLQSMGVSVIPVK